MSLPPYAPFSLECVVEPARMIRARSVSGELPLFAKCVHTLAGSCLGATLGEPVAVELFTGEGVPTEQLEDCQAALTEFEADGELAAGDGEKAIDPVLLMTLVNLAAKLIARVIERRRNPPSTTPAS